MELANQLNNLSISHLHGSNGVTEKIKKAMYETAKQFVYIGFLLKEVRDYKYYEESGYKSVYEYADFELGFKKSSTKNLIAIAETFGIQEYEYLGVRRKNQTMSLQPAYEKFDYSQLVELLAMSPAQRQEAKPDMTVKQLREMKKSKVPTYTTINTETGKLEVIERPEESDQKPTGQTSGHKEPTIEEIEKENNRLNELYCTEANIVTINGEQTQITHYVMNELCRLAGIKYIDWEDYEISIKIADDENIVGPGELYIRNQY